MMVQLFSKMGRRFMQILLCIVPGMFFNHFQYFMVKYSEISYVKCGWIHYISYILVYCPGTSISSHFLKPMAIWALMITALNLCTNMSFHRRLPQGFLLLVYQGWLVLIEIHLLGSSLSLLFDLWFYDQGIQFVMFEIQSKWVAAILSGRVTLPAPEKMMEDLIASYAMLEALGIPKRHTHKLGKIQVRSRFPIWSRV